MRLFGRWPRHPVRGGASLNDTSRPLNSTPPPPPATARATRAGTARTRRTAARRRATAVGRSATARFRRGGRRHLRGRQHRACIRRPYGTGQRACTEQRCGPQQRVRIVTFGVAYPGRSLRAAYVPRVARSPRIVRVPALEQRGAPGRRGAAAPEAGQPSSDDPVRDREHRHADAQQQHGPPAAQTDRKLRSARAQHEQRDRARRHPRRAQLAGRPEPALRTHPVDDLLRVPRKPLAKHAVAYGAGRLLVEPRAVVVVPARACQIRDLHVAALPVNAPQVDRARVRERHRHDLRDPRFAAGEIGDFVGAQPGRSLARAPAPAPDAKFDGLERDDQQQRENAGRHVEREKLRPGVVQHVEILRRCAGRGDARGRRRPYELRQTVAPCAARRHGGHALGLLRLGLGRPVDRTRPDRCRRLAAEQPTIAVERVAVALRVHGGLVGRAGTGHMVQPCAQHIGAEDVPVFERVLQMEMPRGIDRDRRRNRMPGRLREKREALVFVDHGQRVVVRPVFGFGEAPAVRQRRMRIVGRIRVQTREQRLLRIGQRAGSDCGRGRRDGSHQEWARCADGRRDRRLELSLRAILAQRKGGGIAWERPGR